MALLKNWDLGIRKLSSEWKSLFSKETLIADLGAGITVACVAVPLSLAIALASGVEPAVGLTSAIIAGIVCALFGGAPLSVSGPAAAMAVLVASIVETHGLAGLLIVGFGAGIMQVLSGVLGWGRFARFVPMPVIGGFTAGIGAVIFIGQLPRALGLPPPPEAEAVSVLTHILDYAHATNLYSLGLCLMTVVIVLGLPRLSSKVPSALAGVVIITLLVYFSGSETPTVGTFANLLPIPQLPQWPQSPKTGVIELFFSMLTVFGLASLQTLLSSTEVDKLGRGKRHDPDQELIGQGVGNIVVSLFGGIPVSGVIARSALNVRSGARTRLSSVIQSLMVLCLVVYAAPLLSEIPMAALAGVLLTVSLRMMSLHDFKEVLRVSKSDAFIYGLTFVSIIGFDLLAGVQIGIVVAVLITAIRAGQTVIEVHEVDAGESVRVHLSGSLSFLSTGSFERMRRQIDSAKHKGCRRFVVDLTDVQRIDATGAEELIGIVRDTIGDRSKVVLQGVRTNCQEFLIKGDKEKILENLMKASETEVQKALYDSGEDGKGVWAISRLIYGINRFRLKKQVQYQNLLNELADGQTPHTLFVTCSDSRIDPNLLTSTDLGELFFIRNVGNALPPFVEEGSSAEHGALEFSIQVLGIREVVICGHTSCGAMKGVCDTSKLITKPGLKRYLEGSAFANVRLTAAGDPEFAGRVNVMTQMRNLLSYPFIRELHEKGELKVHLWIYDLKRADIDVFNPESGEFLPINYEYAHKTKSLQSFEFAELKEDLKPSQAQ